MSEYTFTVSELANVIRDTLNEVLPDGVWVQGEIQGIKRSRNGHVYFDLIEAAESAGQTPDAKLRVVLFRGYREKVNQLLQEHGDPIRMTDGVRVRIQAMADFYVPYGSLQLRMSAIDPTYTLGMIASERETLLRELHESGLLRANATYSVPTMPTRVGVVTSLGSAAHADITTVFENTAKSFTLVEVDTPVQGQGAENNIAAAITTAAAADVDVVIVARGGGSKTDLAVFDHSLVAHAIVRAHVPVFTGIGHDTDSSVADEVAHTAHTTPTAAAQAVVAYVDEWLGRLSFLESGIARHVRQSVVRADQRLDKIQLRVTNAAHNSLRDATRRVDAAAAQVRALDPARALARGWSITRDSRGQIIRSAAGLEIGDQIETRVADGTLTSTIRATNPTGGTRR